MIQDRYTKQIRNMVEIALPRKNIKVFLFGSAARKTRFRDCDIGFTGKVTKDEVRRLKELLEESDLPYKADVVDFNHVSEAFRRNVMAEPIIWIKR